MGMGMTGIPRNPREWVQLLREYRGDGTKTCGNTAGMEFIAAGNPQVCFGKRAIIQFLTLMCSLSSRKLSLHQRSRQLQTRLFGNNA